MLTRWQKMVPYVAMLHFVQLQKLLIFNDNIHNNGNNNKRTDLE